MKELRPMTLMLLLAGCAESTSPGFRAPDILRSTSMGVAEAPEAVLPSGYKDVMGEVNQNFPHASHRTMRYQQVFLGSDLVDPMIVGLCLRRDEAVATLQREKTLTVRLGPTSLDYTNFGASFDGNYSAAPTEVFSGSVTVPAAAIGGTPADFDLCIPFTQAYEHPAGSNVIVEVINTSVDLGSAARDACESGVPACTTARAWAFSPVATTATNFDRSGLVMKFVSPAPPKPVDPVSHEECFKGGWSDFEFRNQGQCVRFVETGLDSRIPDVEA
jgi:hypothetical protein